MAELDPTLYNGPARQEHALPEKATPEYSVGAVPLESTLEPTAAFARSAELRTANSIPEATAVEAAQASMGNWRTKGIYDFLTHPTFEPDGTSASDQLQHAQIVLNNDEAELYSKRKSIAEGNYLLDQIKAARSRNEAVQGHAGIAMVMAGLDPVNWLVPFGAAKAAAGATAVGLGVGASRAVASGVAAGLSVAGDLAASEVRSVRTEDIYLNAILEGIAAPMMVHGAPRVRVNAKTGEEVVKPVVSQLDPEFPAKELQEIAKPAVPKTEPVPYIGKAVGDEGDIFLHQKEGQFELHYTEEGKEVRELYETREEAMDAFDDAADFMNANIEVNPSKASTKKVKDTVMYEDVGLRKQPDVIEALTPGMAHDPIEVAKAVDKVVAKEVKTYAERTGEALQWNIRKTMANYSPETSELADLLFDNQRNYKVTSAESHKRAVQAELKTGMWQFDEQLKGAMADAGYGLRKQIFDKGAATAQRGIEQKVSLEMLRRDQMWRQGREILHDEVLPAVKNMADSLDRIAKQVATEMKAAGVKGAEELEHHTGWASRKWSSVALDDVMARVQKYGHTAEEAKTKVIRMVAESMADANASKNWTWELAHDVATSTVNRALRKGAFEDAVFNANQGADSAKVIRDMLTADGLKGARLQRVMDVLIGKSDESSKAGFLKHRVDLDYTTNLDLGGEQINITELFDHDIKNTFDKYIDKASAEIAMARKGITSASELEAWRAKGIASLKGDRAKQEEFVKLFDESIKALKGEASGADIGQALRNTAAISRLTTLGSSGLWQVTEYAKMAQRYGAAKTIKYFVQEMPMFKKTLETAAANKFESTHLKDILTHASEEGTRIQPYVRRFADGFEMPANATLSARLQHATQLVPYMNGLKWVHGHQARIMANLTIDCINRAATGDLKMAKVLEQYGVTPEMLGTLKSDVVEHGMQVDSWTDGSWMNVRPAFMKMMDEGVLHARMGDTPAFALLNPVGKFICTYRSFVLTSHNKLLAGTTAREGFAGVGLMLMYQYPLAALAVQAQTTINGKKELTGKQLAVASLGQMGGLGMIGEVAGILSGTKSQIGAPGMIPFDRAAKLAGAIGGNLAGDQKYAQTAHAAFQTAPFLAILPPLKALEGWGQAKAKE